MTRKKLTRRRTKKPLEVLVDEPTAGVAGEGVVPLTVEVLRQQQNDLLSHLPEVTRRRLRYLAKHYDIPELAALRMAIAETYQNALDEED